MFNFVYRQRYTAAAIVAFSVLSACQTTRSKEFSGLRSGMSKSEALSQAGGPDVTRRWQGKDRWIYNYGRIPGDESSREVHFENGRAVYVGQRVVPKISAADHDRLNEQSNAAQEKRDADEQRHWNEEHGVANTLKTGNQLDRQDLRIQKSMYGTTSDRERKQIAPQYESVE